MKRVDVRPRRVVEVRGEVVERVRRGDQLQPRRFPRRLNPQRVRQRLCRRFPLPSVVRAHAAGERVDQAAIVPGDRPARRARRPQHELRVRREQVKSKQSPAIVVVGLRDGRLLRRRRRSFARRRQRAKDRGPDPRDERVGSPDARSRRRGLDGARYERARDEPARVGRLVVIRVRRRIGSRVSSRFGCFGFVAAKSRPSFGPPRRRRPGLRHHPQRDVREGGQRRQRRGSRGPRDDHLARSLLRDDVGERGRDEDSRAGVERRVVGTPVGTPVGTLVDTPLRDAPEAQPRQAFRGVPVPSPGDDGDHLVDRLVPCRIVDVRTLAPPGE